MKTLHLKEDVPWRVWICIWKMRAKEVEFYSPDYVVIPDDMIIFALLAYSDYINKIVDYEKG